MLNDLPVIVGLATIETRKEALIDTLESIYRQADEVHVYYNDYTPDPVPQFPNVIQHLAPDGDLGDAAMMWAFTDERAKVPAYYMPIPDDLIYSPDYCETMVIGIERYDRKAGVGFHGRIQYGPCNSFYRDLPGSGAVRCLDDVWEDTPVTILSTAAAGWYSELIRFSMDDFPQTHGGLNSRNMADVWFSKRLQEENVPRVVLIHEAGWIQHTEKFDIDTTIARLARNDDFVQTSVFNSVEWKL